MTSCDRCDSSNDTIRTCSECGGSYCSGHILSSSHNCFTEDTSSGDRNPDALADEWVDDTEDSHGRTPFGLSFDSDSFSTTEESDQSRISAVFSGNMTYLFLGIMAGTTAAQYILLPLFLGITPDDGLWRAIFVLDASNIEYAWTWVTSVFAHSGFRHLLLNALVVLFFGKVVERRLGSLRYAAFFVGTGAIAGLAQVSVSAATGGLGAVYGASGAGLAILGFVSLIMPNRTVHILGIIPAPIWVITALFGAASVFGIISGGAGAGGIAQVGHLIGLLLGLGVVYIHRGGDVEWPSLSFNND